MTATGTELVGAGQVRISLTQFLRQLTTFRIRGAKSTTESVQSLRRFGQFFIGRAWDVYARKILDYAPL